MSHSVPFWPVFPTLSSKNTGVARSCEAEEALPPNSRRAVKTASINWSLTNKNSGHSKLSGFEWPFFHALIFAAGSGYGTSYETDGPSNGPLWFLQNAPFCPMRTTSLKRLSIALSVFLQPRLRPFGTSSAPSRTAPKPAL